MIYFIKFTDVIFTVTAQPINSLSGRVGYSSGSTRKQVHGPAFTPLQATLDSHRHSTD